MRTTDAATMPTTVKTTFAVLIAHHLSKWWRATPGPLGPSLSHACLSLGRTTVNVEPDCGVLSTFTVPPKASTMVRTM